MWHYIGANCSGERPLRCSLEEFSYSVCASCADRHSIRKTTVCLDILKELGLIRLHREYMTVEVQLMQETRFNALQNSRLYCKLGGE